MGTLTIIEYSAVGTDANRDAPVLDLNTATKTTVDATTSGTAESLVLGINTRLIEVIGAEDHRISVKSSDCTDQYTIVGTSGKELGVLPEQTLYYRTD